MSRTAPLSALLLVLLALSAPAQAANVRVTSHQRGPLSMQLSTNDVWSGMLAQTPGGLSSLRALHMPLVRLHVGDDGWPVAMPEVVRGRWSMAALDRLVDDVTSTGSRPLMNIKFAPDWMWTCHRFGAGGEVADRSFATFAEYMARLVAYYNRGSLTTESGRQIVNPAGTRNRVTYWELWNEPDLNNETPCAPASGVALSPSQYVTMWNAVTRKMLAVDPTIRFVGPAAANGQFGSGAGTDYFSTLEQGARVKPAALSFHGYGYWDNTVSDRVIFNGDRSGAGGIPDMARTARSLHHAYPATPIWMTEVNVNADWGNDPLGRPSKAFGAAWWGSAFVRLAGDGVSLMHEYDFVDAPQFGLISDTTGRRRLPYWTVKGLDAAFPPGSTRLQTRVSGRGIDALAARRPDGSLVVLVVNRRISSARPGQGEAARIAVSLPPTAARTIHIQRIDSRTSLRHGPGTTTVRGANAVVRFRGYGLAILTYG